MSSTWLNPRVALAIAGMILVVSASNYLVQFPVIAEIGALNLADLLTWGAFTYPAAFLVTDLTNRHFGPRIARRVVFAGFLMAVILSAALFNPRIAIASGTAFLAAQLLDVAVFDRLRNGLWWSAPLVSSVFGSLLDTALFFSLAFSASFGVLGATDGFAVETAPLLGLLSAEAPRWVSWALGDLGVKLLVALILLAPYRVVLAFIPPKPADGAAA